jgi:hypothetical protein
MKACLELHDPVAAMQNEEIAVQSIEHLDTLATLFPHQGENGAERRYTSNGEQIVFCV